MTEKILPIPCTKVEEKTVKDWFQKINEEMDELKEAVWETFDMRGEACQKTTAECLEIIAEEAADTITAITSMLEAMGIGEDMRQAAQRQVNEKNKECGRF